MDKVIKYHLKNSDSDIVVPSLKIRETFNENIVKIVKDNNEKVLYFSRSTIPFGFKNKNKFVDKHLSIISFKPNALKLFTKSKQAKLEKIEGVELLRALEIGLKIKSPSFFGDSFSVDVKEDYIKAKIKFDTDKFYKLYRDL
ncbi:MAG: hypothetical protein CMI71_00985 [Candidatus Pelagibacter sp.]|nr:hypothetical protein [Candidatus Pelagibacter sp.]